KIAKEIIGGDATGVDPLGTVDAVALLSHRLAPEDVGAGAPSQTAAEAGLRRQPLESHRRRFGEAVLLLDLRNRLDEALLELNVHEFVEGGHCNSVRLPLRRNHATGVAPLTVGACARTSRARRRTRGPSDRRRWCRGPRRRG